MQDAAAGRRHLIECAETVLRPGLAILIECAFEAERNKKAARFLEELVDRFYVCAEKRMPLAGDKYEVFDMRDDAGFAAVGLISEETAAAESVFASDLLPGADGFVKYMSKHIAALELAKFAPAVLGIGIADNEDEARFLARTALFRSPDRHSSDAATAECERRILAAVNREGPGAGGLGGGHTALAVSIEQGGAGFIALCPGDYFTRFAKLRSGDNLSADQKKQEGFYETDNN